jgi:DNA-binding MarR family transcriptional regulator
MSRQRNTADQDVQAAISRALAGPMTGYLLNLAHRYARGATNQALRAHGIDLRHMGVLAYLAEAGPASQRTLASALQMDKSSMVYVVDELERQGLAERQRTRQDRRSYAVRITPQGHQRLRAADTTAAAVMEQLLTPFSAPERRQLDELLSRFVVHARQHG